MDEEDFFNNNNRFRICHNFKYKIDKVWKIMSKLERYNEICEEDSIGKVIMSKGESTSELNCELLIDWDGFPQLKLKCTEVINTDIFKKINWHADVEELELSYNFSYTFLHNSSDNSTILIWEIDFYKFGNQLSTFLNAMEALSDTLIETYEKYLAKNLEDLFQYESIIIKSNAQEVFELVSDWRKLSSVTSLIADAVEYKDDPLKLGTELIIKFNAKKMKCFLKVIKIDQDQTTNEWNYHLECYDSKPKVPLQVIQFNIIKISEDSCLLSFKHIFKQSLKSDSIDSISEEKRNILKIIKMYLENEQ